MFTTCRIGTAPREVRLGKPRCRRTAIWIGKRACTDRSQSESSFRPTTCSTMPNAALVSAPGRIAEPVCSGPIWIRYAKAAVAGDGLHPALLEIQHGAILRDGADAQGLHRAPRTVAVIGLGGAKVEQRRHPTAPMRNAMRMMASFASSAFARKIIG